MISSVHVAVLIKSLVMVNCAAMIDECIRSNGVEYRGKQQKSSSGNMCLNWNSTSIDMTQHKAMDTGVGDHNFCRNPDGSERPWCYVSGADGQLQREACVIDSCQDQSSTEGPGPTAKSAATDAKTNGTDRTTSAQKEAAVLQPVMGVSQRVRTGPKKKKDLGTLGYVLGILMMAIIIILGVGITVGYFYKRGRDLKKQHEQRVYEREMHRITLPLSAFSNPSCELVDENTVVVTAQSESVDQAQARASGEGSAPLMGPAGTPGA